MNLWLFKIISVAPLTAIISALDSVLVADRRYDLLCHSAGSRPPALITWYRNDKKLTKIKVSHIFNTTLTFKKNISPFLYTYWNDVILRICLCNHAEIIIWETWRNHFYTILLLIQNTYYWININIVIIYINTYTLF